MSTKHRSQQYLKLKENLDALHYNQQFTLDSMDLVETLLRDLIKTTEQYHNMKKRYEEANDKYYQQDKTIQPLKLKIKQLTTEGNQLHLELIHTKEDLESSNDQWKTKLKSLLGENKDLKFLVDQLRKQRAATSSSHELPDHSSKFQISGHLGEKKILEGQTFGIRGDTESLTVAQQIEQVSLEKQSAQLRDLQTQNDLLLNQIQHLELKIRNRDTEIERLQQHVQVEVIDNKKLGLEYEIQVLRETLERKEHQIDLLNKELTEIQGIRNKEKPLDYVRQENREKTERIHQLTEQLTDREKEIAQLKNYQQTLIKNRDYILQNSGVQQERQNLASKIKELEQFIEVQKDQNQQIITINEEKVRQLQEQIRELQTATSTNGQEFQRLRRENGDLQRESETLRSENAELREKLAYYDKNSNELRENLSREQLLNENDRERIGEIVEENLDLHEQVQNKENRLVEYEAKLQQLEQDLSSVQSVKEQEIAELREKLDIHQYQEEQYQKQVEDLRNRLEQAAQTQSLPAEQNPELIREYQNTLKLNQSELSKHEIRLRKLEEQNKGLREAKEEVLRENDELKQSLEQLRNLNFDLQGQLRGTQQSSSSPNKQQSTGKIDRSQQLLPCNSKSGKLQKIQDKDLVFKLENQISHLEKKVASLTSQLEKKERWAQQSMEKQIYQINDISRSQAGMHKNIQQRDELIESLQISILDKENQVRELLLDLKDRDLTISKQSEQIVLLEHAISQKDGQIDLLIDKINLFETGEGQTHQIMEKIHDKEQINRLELENQDLRRQVLEGGGQNLIEELHNSLDQLRQELQYTELQNQDLYRENLTLKEENVILLQENQNNQNQNKDYMKAMREIMNLQQQLEILTKRIQK